MAAGRCTSRPWQCRFQVYSSGGRVDRLTDPGAAGTHVGPASLVVAGQAGRCFRYHWAGQARAAHRPGERVWLVPAATAEPVPERVVDGGGSGTGRLAVPRLRL